MSSNIQYTSDLIDGFEQDHRALLNSYGRLNQTANRTSFAAFPAEMADFKSMLGSHLLTEAVKLDIYLRQDFKEEPAKYCVVTGYKTEMDGIGRVAMGLIESCGTAPADSVDFAMLSTQPGDIGKAFGDRTRR